MDTVDSVRYPRLARYLASLPNGLSSHPECKATVAVYRHFLEAKPVGDVPPNALPAELLTAMRSKLPVSNWIEDVKVAAILVAIADHHRMTDREWLAWNREENERFLGGRFFRVLMSVASPKLLVMGAQLRWGAIRQGSQLKTEKINDKGLTIALSYPTHLFPELLLNAFATGFEASIALSNAKGAKVELVRYDAFQATYRAQWN